MKPTHLHLITESDRDAPRPSRETSGEGLWNLCADTAACNYSHKLSPTSLLPFPNAAHNPSGRSLALLPLFHGVHIAHNVGYSFLRRREEIGESCLVASAIIAPPRHRRRVYENSR